MRLRQRFGRSTSRGEQLRQAIGLCGVLGVLTLGLLQWRIVQFQQRLREVERLLASGSRAEGVVRDVVAGMKGGKTIEYEFRVKGSVYRGSSGLLGDEEPAVGSGVEIRYSEVSPRENTLADGMERQWLVSMLVKLRVVEGLVLVSWIVLLLLLTQIRKREKRRQEGGGV
ncbi:DUF3592 domain-containing protein [Chthonomonas calidirosea]|uniref:DUF3592 domain-containing protein n=1 Tax=Chthonomonas calidirosea TaxID=454171 RepID=UPI0006ECB665|nr:DUF3592 domain-containing protein [Chthonomonas calidirosea]CEK12785.1 hypothetical protein CP488_00200 [Chthonomonas calidirosea]